MESVKRVLCLIVTYNRKNYLFSLFKSLLSQTKEVSGIVLVNNNSTDGTDIELINNGMVNDIETKDFVLKTKFQKMDFFFYNSSRNLGGSGGFKKGFEIVQKIDYDYLWVMDDDISPRNDCLEILVHSFDSNHKIVVPKRIGKDFYDPIITKYRFTNPFVHLFLPRCSTPKKPIKNSYDVKVFTFEGPLFSKEIIDKVGLPDSSYFLQGDDYDFAFRCLKFSSIKYCQNAIINRQIPFVKANPKSYDKLYYSLRNECVLDFKYSKVPFFAKIRVLNYQFRWFLIGLRHRDNLEKKVVKKAFYDAKNYISGKFYFENLREKE